LHHGIFFLTQFAARIAVFDFYEFQSIYVCSLCFAESKALMKVIRKMGILIMFSLVLCSIFYSINPGIIPKGFSRDEWQMFVARIFGGNNNELFILVCLLFVQIAHVIFCVPLVNITQILYGYLFGFISGTSISFCWEIILVTLYVLIANRGATYNDTGMEKFVLYIRSRKMIYPMVLMLQFSSIPVNAHSLIIGYGHTTCYEYLLFYYISALLNSVKNCFVGDFIKNSDMTPEHLSMVSTFVFVTVLLPPLIALFIFNGTYNFYDAIEVENVVEKEHLTTADEARVSALSASWSSYFLVVHPRLFTQVCAKIIARKHSPETDEELSLISCTTESQETKPTQKVDS